ncbi:MAG TPA: accessory factor UbiK family protein [Devosia sp.]|nr:accessory factor UbiK family protein [Devosia sp.]
MTQASSRLLDNVGRMMNDAAGIAEGMRREIESMVRAQAERFVMDMNLVKREDYDALRELVQTQSAELRTLKAEVAALKAGASAGSGASSGAGETPKAP